MKQVEAEVEDSTLEGRKSSRLKNHLFAQRKAGSLDLRVYMCLKKASSNAHRFDKPVSLKKLGF